jgi:PAS domain S-box-containing protein
MIADISEFLSLDSDRPDPLDSLNGLPRHLDRGGWHACPDSVTEAVMLRVAAEPAKVVTDPDGMVVEINPAFSALCGYTFGEIRGRKPGSLLQGPLTLPDTIDMLRHAITTRTRCAVDMVNYHKDLSPYRVHIELRPLFKPSGRLSGFEAREWKLP